MNKDKINISLTMFIDQNQRALIEEHLRNKDFILTQKEFLSLLDDKKAMYIDGYTAEQIQEDFSMKLNLIQ